MDAYAQTGLGVLVSVVLFLIGYKQTIGARKERVQAANKALHRMLLRRIVLEDYKPRIKDIGRMTEGKAREFQVSVVDMMSTEQLLNQIFTDVFESDFIAPTLRLNIEVRIEEVFTEFNREKKSVVSLDPEPHALASDASRRKFLTAMGVATSTVGAVATLTYMASRGGWLENAAEISDLKLLLPAVAVFVGSLGVIASILMLKRTRDVQDETVSIRTTLVAERELIEEIVVILRRNNLSFQISPRIGHQRPDFVVEIHNRKVVIEAKTWRSSPPIHIVARARDFAHALLSTGKVDEVFIVSLAGSIIADSESIERRVKFLNIKELPNILRREMERT